MGRYAWRIDRFDSSSHLRGRKRTYESVRAAVVEAGRFSVFEATNSDQDARWFTQLESDPLVEVRRDFSYPWIGPVRWRESSAMGILAERRQTA
jgi:hypothetical protein